MSLQVWLPLNGDLRNQGCSPFTITSIEATPTFTTGKIGQCYQRTDSNAQVTKGLRLDDNLINTFGSQASVAVWVKPLGTHTHYNGTILSSGNWNAKKWAFGVSQDNTKVDVLCGSYNNYITCDVPVNAWTHLVSIYDNGTCTLYKNGIYIGQLVNQKAFETDANWTGICRETYASGYFGFNGCINDLRIYDHCLSAAEVKEISQGLVLHYKLDDLTNGIEDSSGYGHHGTILNAPLTLVSSPRYNNGVSFTATNKKIKSGEITTSGFSNSYSISWWGKSNTYSGMHWGFGDGIRLNGIYGGNLWNTGDSAKNPLYIPGTTTQVTAPTANIWHHFVMTGDGTACKAYKDGILWGQAKTYKTISGTIIYINGWNTSTSYSYNDLQVSDFRVYSTALSADDILQLYHTSAKVDNLQNLHTFELVENNLKTEINKRGQLICNELNEDTATKFYKSGNLIETNEIIEL